jgi:hypothetical protein
MAHLETGLAKAGLRGKKIDLRKGITFEKSKKLPHEKGGRDDIINSSLC